MSKIDVVCPVAMKHRALSIMVIRLQEINAFAASLARKPSAQLPIQLRYTRYPSISQNQEKWQVMLSGHWWPTMGTRITGKIVVPEGTPQILQQMAGTEYGQERKTSYNIHKMMQTPKPGPCTSAALSPDPPLKSATAPARRAGTASLLIMNVVTRLWCCCKYRRG